MTQLTVTQEHKEKTAQLMWVGFILMFFLIQAVIWTIAISVTATDPSHAVVSGYDEKALLWDDEKARRVASDQLGWQAEIGVASAGDLQGFRELTVTLTDADGQPISGASLEMTSFHVARAGEPQRVGLTEDQSGVYRGHMRIRKPGWWQFSGTAVKGDDTLLVDERQSIMAAN